MKTWVILILYLFSVSNWAEESFPPGCIPLPIKNNQIQISHTLPGIILLQNQNPYDLWVKIDEKKEGLEETSAMTHLDRNHWSAIGVTQKKLELSCVESMPGHEQQIRCTEVMAVCYWQKGIFPQKALGLHVAHENKPLSLLLSYLGREGYEKES